MTMAKINFFFFLSKIRNKTGYALFVKWIQFLVYEI
jgi:hypothetical protein